VHTRRRTNIIVPFIRILSEHGPEERFELTGAVITAGRASANDLRLDDAAASREHFELLRSGGGYGIRDLGSRNGTVVNGTPVSGERRLSHGDEIAVGRTRLLYSEEGATEAVPRVHGDSATVMFEAKALSSSYLEEARGSRDERSRTDLIHLNELARELMSVADEEQLFELLSGRVLHMLGGDRCAVVLGADSDESAIEVKALACSDPGASRDVQISSTAARHVLDDAMALLLTDAGEDERFKAQHSIVVGNIQSILCAPLWYGDSVFGLLYLDATARPGAFTRDHLALLSAIANLAAIKIDNLRLFAATIAKARMERELTLAAEIQARMLPRRDFVFPGFVCLGFNRACYEVGGDYYDFMPTVDGGFSVTVADVSGKGAAAALLMASCKSMLTAHTQAGVPIADRVAKLNTYVIDNSTANKFVTFFHAELDPISGTLRYCNAGHNPPLLLGPEAAVRTLEPTGTILGLFETPFEVEEVPFGTGSVLIAFSDGVTEAVDQDDEEYGDDRLVNLVVRLSHLDPAALRDAILDDVGRFTGGAPPSDDVTLVIVKREAGS
jgi:phosphoserine phosphatase RsbU/P